MTVVNGNLAEPGEVDLYSVEAGAGEAWTFDVVAGGSAFDPVVTLLEPAADSWFSTKGWKRLATNSAKLVNILGGYGYQPVLASMEACIDAAEQGRLA